MTPVPVVLDVETVPTLAALAMPYPEAPRPHPANYKDAEKIQSWRDADRLKWLSLHHGIAPTLASETIRAWFAKYRVQPHTDVRDVLTQWNQYGDGTLGEWCAFLGVPYDSAGLTGADVYELHRAGRWQEIAAKCQADVMATRGLLERIGGTFTVAAA